MPSHVMSIDISTDALLTRNAARLLVHGLNVMHQREKELEIRWSNVKIKIPNGDQLISTQLPLDT